MTILGASFSHTHLKSLGLDPQKALLDYLKLNFTWIRLGLYWSEVEKAKGKYDFHEIDKLLQVCEKNKLKVILTVGMKAPRYPEYYIPEWCAKNKNKILSTVPGNSKELENSALRFIAKAVLHFKKYKSIKVWQVENEPLDPSGDHYWKIDKRFLTKELTLVRGLDNTRKIAITIWANQLSLRQNYKFKIPVSLYDIVGLDIYLRHPPVINFLGFYKKYSGPFDSSEKIKKIASEIKAQGKEVWITELQAEPWEPNTLVANESHPKSFLPKHFKSNLEYAKKINASAILFWGFEWWYLQKVRGNFDYWNEAINTIKDRQNSFLT